jgi:hypothetical protein
LQLEVGVLTLPERVEPLFVLKRKLLVNCFDKIVERPCPITLDGCSRIIESLVNVFQNAGCPFVTVGVSLILRDRFS